MRRISLAERSLVRAHQAGRRLVEQQHLRTRGERARDLDQAAVDMRQVARGRRDGAVIADEGQQRFGGAAVSCVPAEPAADCRASLAAAR